MGAPIQTGTEELRSTTAWVDLLSRQKPLGIPVQTRRGTGSFWNHFDSSPPLLGNRLLFVCGDQENQSPICHILWLVSIRAIHHVLKHFVHVNF